MSLIWRFEIKKKKSIENSVANQLSRLELQNSIALIPINDSFSDEQVLSMQDSNVPWNVDMANFKAKNIIPKDFTLQ